VGVGAPEIERPAAAPLSWVPPDPATLCAVTVVVRAGALQAVGEVLDRWDLAGDAVFQPVSGTGRGGGRTVRFRGQKRTEPLARVAVTVPVAAADAEALADQVTSAARHGEKGDGKVWVV
jgi:nitrogen regulatory protein PII